MELPIVKQEEPRSIAAEVCRLVDASLERTPMLYCAAGLMAGILGRAYLPQGLMPWLGIMFAVAALAAGLAAKALAPGRSRALAAAFSATLAFAALGSVRAGAWLDPLPDHIASMAGDDETIADIRGVIVSDVRTYKLDPVRTFYRDPASTFELEVREVRCREGWRDARGLVRARVGEPVYDLERGDYIEAMCVLRAIDGPMNPGQFDSAAHLARQDVRRTAFVRSRAAVAVLESGQRAGWYSRAGNRLRERARSSIEAGGHDHDVEGLLQALLLGVRTDISPEVYEAFRRTGLLHYISLSGLHVGIFTGVLWWLAKVAGMGRRSRAVLIAIAMFVFLMVVPWRAPILRAAIICFAFVAAELVGRRSSPFNTLAVAAVIILVFRPLELFAVGWQLSFSCMVGILLLARPMAQWLSDWPVRVLARRPLLEAAGRSGPLGFLWQTSAATFGMGLAAWLGGGPVMLYHFHTLTPLAAVWTVLTFPFAAGVVTFGFAALVAAPVSPGLGGLFNRAAGSLADVFIWLVERFSALGISEFEIGHVPMWSMALAGLAVVYVGAVRWPGEKIRRRTALVMVLAAVVSLGGLRAWRLHGGGVEVTVLSVGHGQAIVAALPGRTLLLDAGSNTTYAVGRRIIVPYMRWSGGRPVSKLLVSHAHGDHYNAAGEVARRYPDMSVAVSELWPEDFAATDWEFEEVRRIAIGENIAFGDASLTVLWPCRDERDGDIGENDASLVLLLEYAGRRVLFCGDIERYAQGRLMELYPDLRADVIVLPHHGSGGTTNPAFIESVAATIEICSCDRLQASRSLDVSGRAVRYSTAADGAVTIRIDRRGNITVQTFLK